MGGGKQWQRKENTRTNKPTLRPSSGFALRIHLEYSRINSSRLVPVARKSKYRSSLFSSSNASLASTKLSLLQLWHKCGTNCNSVFPCYVLNFLVYHTQKCHHRPQPLLVASRLSRACQPFFPLGCPTIVPKYSNFKISQTSSRCGRRFATSFSTLTYPINQTHEPISKVPWKLVVILISLPWFSTTRVFRSYPSQCDQPLGWDTNK